MLEEGCKPEMEKERRFSLLLPEPWTSDMQSNPFGKKERWGKRVRHQLVIARSVGHWLKIELKVQRFPIVTPSATHVYPPCYQHHSLSGTLVKTDGPTLTHHFKPKSIRVHACCCAFYRFRRMYDMYPPNSVIQNSFMYLFFLPP